MNEARVSTAWIQGSLVARATCVTVIAILCGAILLIGLVYTVASGVALLQR